MNFAFYLPGALLNLRGNSILKDICKMRAKSNSQNAGCALFVMGAGGRGSSTWVAAFAAHQHHRTAMPLMKWVWWRAGFSRDESSPGREGESGWRERESISATKKVDSKVDNGQPSLSLFVTTALSSTRDRLTDCVRLGGIISCAILGIGMRDHGRTREWLNILRKSGSF